MGQRERDAQAAMYRMVAENTVDVIIRYDNTGRRLFVSPSVFDMIGMTPEQMVGGHALDLLHPDDVEQARTIIAKIGPDEPSLANIFRVRASHGDYLWIDGRYRYLKEDGGHVAVLRDITANRRIEEMLAESHRQLAAANLELQRLVHQDGLTGLANRRRFEEVLEQELARARRDRLQLSLVLLDVDYFKVYNDQYGHLAGDDCLRRVCQAVEGALFRPADLAARYGGEEIVAVLPDTDDCGAFTTAERIREAVAALRIEHLGGVRGFVTVSGGTSSMLPWDDGPTSLDLIAAADKALYRAKESGRDRICVAGCRFIPAYED